MVMISFLVIGLMCFEGTPQGRGVHLAQRSCTGLGVSSPFLDSAIRPWT